jgi:acid phosphatase (class A)
VFSFPHRCAIAIAFLVWTAGSAANAAGSLPGYLGPDFPAQASALIPPAPAEASPEFLRDIVDSRARHVADGSADFAAAAQDAQRWWPSELAPTYQAASGLDLDPKAVPALYYVLSKALSDATATFGTAKTGNDAGAGHSHRRPYAVFQGADTMACLDPPSGPDHLDPAQSYPSGHAMNGYLTGLILIELAPADRRQAVRQRGAAFGLHRIVCRAHWLSDVEAGQELARIEFDHLQADGVFRADMACVRRQLAGKDLRKERDCRALLARMKKDDDAYHWSAPPS